MITALEIGDEQVFGPQLTQLPVGFDPDTGIPVGIAAAPRQWTARILLYEEYANRHSLRWLAPSRQEAILSDERVGWFTITLPAEDDAYYANGLFQAALVEGGYATGYLEAMPPP
jgi:hypothetical protein